MRGGGHSGVGRSSSSCDGLMLGTRAISMADSQLMVEQKSNQNSWSDGTASPITRFMMLLALIFAAVAATTSNTSAPASTEIFDSGVPTNEPVSGNYTGALRPQIHFSPPQNFLNDPNGCHRDQNGIYHLYYQCRSNLT